MCKRPGPANQSFASCSFPLQIISQKDEHCWVGELNGLRGEALVWSPGEGGGLGSKAGQSLLHPFGPATCRQQLG